MKKLLVIKDLAETRKNLLKIEGFESYHSNFQN